MSSSPDTPRPSICEPRTLADQVSSPHLDIINYPAAQTICVVAELLESIIAQNDKLPSAALTHFHSRSVPKIPVHAYLARIQKFAPFSNEVLITILVYFDRIARRHTSFVISSFNIHRLLITSLTVASKFVSDVFYANVRYAKVGGLPLAELNRLELEFLFLCNFDLYVRLEDLQEYANQLLLRRSPDCSLPTSPITSVSDEYAVSSGVSTPSDSNPAAAVPETFISPRPSDIHHSTAAVAALMTPPPQTKHSQPMSVQTDLQPSRKRRRESWSVPATRAVSWMPADTSMRAGY
ncbi:hypothetical protein INT43_008964 [Umbelopsis isabellina]|uniref:Cyclin-domain-containing protein n=1 Tax=Mortierella isabellina TaxID=91625 RepID=A0A8H7PYB0_MORIS|nr:hypothetical protein INT43_008964 [Umbelopsis isabellina]